MADSIKDCDKLWGVKTIKLIYLQTYLGCDISLLRKKDIDNKIDKFSTIYMNI